MNTTIVFAEKIKDLPFYMIEEIFAYLIPDINQIEFKKEKPCSSYNCYSPKYDVAFFKNKKIMNNIEDDIDNYYLCRIIKKNGKHRYYITKEEVDCIQVDYGDREVNMFHFDYISKYIGKNLLKAVVSVIYKNK
jgi:hypothetical protein